MQGQSKNEQKHRLAGLGKIRKKLDVPIRTMTVAFLVTTGKSTSKLSKRVTYRVRGKCSMISRLPVADMTHSLPAGLAGRSYHLRRVWRPQGGTRRRRQGQINCSK